MHIRPAQSIDITLLTALYTERQTIVAQADPHVRPPATDPHWLNRDTGLVLVGGEPVGGYVSLWAKQWPGGALPADTALIDHMAVDAHAYYPALGRSLIDAARAWARECDATRFVALVPRYEPVSQAFWRSMHAYPLDDVRGFPSFSGYQIFQVGSSTDRPHKGGGLR